MLGNRPEPPNEHERPVWVWVVRVANHSIKVPNVVGNIHALNVHHVRLPIFTNPSADNQPFNCRRRLPIISHG